MKNNLWSDLGKEESRRISLKANLFAYKTKDEAPSLVIKFKNEIKLEQLKKIQINSIKFIYNENLFIILEDLKFLDFFDYICRDIKEIIEENSEKNELEIIESRLELWQEMMKKKNKKLALSIQMGLYTELLFLLEKSYKQSKLRENIIAWNGPDGSKQDFYFDDIAIEIKSKKTSNKNEVTISSEDQLLFEKDKGYLICYSLSEGIQGKTVKILVEKILKKIEKQEIKEKTKFLKKVIEYGYNPFFEYEDLRSFIVDDIKFYLVDEKFPKITSEMIDSRISKVSYKINLSLCVEGRIENLEEMQYE